MNDGTFLYSFSRIFVVIGKPVSLIILSTFYLDEQANRLALFFLVGSLSCVFFSFNTYKIIIPGINNKATSLKFKSVQNIQILLSSFFIFCIGSIFYLFEFKNIFSLCLISSLEFYSHEKQRNYLYQGNFLNYSLILLFSFIFILSLSLLLIFSRFEFFISLIFLLIFYIFLLGRVLSSPESSNNFKYLFKIISNEGISFLLPILSRLTMSLDRMMISLFYPSNLWQITVLSQYFFAFVLIYDLFNLGPQKYKILKKAKDFSEVSIKKIIFNGMKKNFIFFLISLTLFLPILFSLFSPMLLKIEIIYILSLLIFLTSFLYAFSEKLHEVLFWLNKSHSISLLYLLNIILIFLITYFAVFYGLNFLISWLLIVLSISFLKFFGLYYLLKIS